MKNIESLSFLKPHEELHPKQLQCYQSPATEQLFGGGAGGAKSHLLRWVAINASLIVPGIQVYLFRRTAPDLRKNHVDGPTGLTSMLATMINNKQVKFNTQVGQIVFSNGSMIHLCHCQHEKDRYNFQGSEIHLLIIDELTHFTDKIYRYLRGRVRMVGLELPKQLENVFPKIICGSNPGGKGHNWVKHTFISQAPALTVWRTPADEGGLLRQFMPSLMVDNPTLMQTDPEYINRLAGLGDPALVKAMRDGDWDVVAGGIIDDLWDKPTHCIEPFKIPDNWMINRSHDYGSAKPHATSWWAQSNGEEVTLADGSTRAFPRGTLFMIRELYGWGGAPDTGTRETPAEIAKKVMAVDKSLRPRCNPYGAHPDSPQMQRRVAPGPADNSIYDVSGGHCIASEMAKEGCRWSRSNKSPGSRINGLELLRARLKASTAIPMEQPGIFFFNTCLHTLRTIPVLPRSESNPEDCDSATEDHLYDAIRYRLLAPKMGCTSQEV